MSETRGRFVWFDLLTTDPAAGKAFYTDLIGWKIADWHQGAYEMWTVGDKPVGGVMKLQDEAAKAGQPPHWLGYIATQNVDATAQRAQQLGGKVVVPGADIPATGRYAILMDPQGAAFGVFQATGGMEGAPDRMALGHFGWAELNTTDWKAAWSFYSELFGWQKIQSMDMGPELGEYFIFGLDGNTLGGMCDSSKMTKAPPHWLHYANIQSVDEAAKRIPERGGKVLNGPMEVPGGDRIVQAMDPQGAAFAIVSSPNRKA